MQFVDYALIVLAVALATVFIVVVGQYMPVLAAAMAFFGPVAVLLYMGE